MPSHPDRVRKNYHDIRIEEIVYPFTNEVEVHINISRLAIASCMSKREIKRAIHKIIERNMNNQLFFFP